MKMTPFRPAREQVLFYLEPTTEFGSPLFRYATFRNSILPQIRSLSEDGFDVYVLLSCEVWNQAVQDGYVRDFNNVVTVDPVDWANGESSVSRSLRIHREGVPHSELNRLKALIASSPAAAKLMPTLVISWESPAGYFSEIFEGARVIYQMPGFFSRPPFAPLVSFDTGLLGDCSPIEPPANLQLEMTPLREYRERERTFFSLMSPASAALERIRRRFSSVVLFPLQVDGYFMIDGPLMRRQTQYDALTAFLAALPADVGVWVTNYRSKDAKSEVINEKNRRYLQQRFPNFIYTNEIYDIDNLSQFLAPETDGVVTISSSLGYQAAFWQKPLFTIGDSHITPFRSATSISQFSAQVKNKELIDRDPLVLGALSCKHLPMSMLGSSRYGTWIRELLRNGKFTKWTQWPIADCLTEERREQEALVTVHKRLQTSLRYEGILPRQLATEIAAHKVISFDIFDTLLQRPTRTPTDLFALMQDEAREITGLPALDFVFERRQAEQETFKAAVARGLGEITIDEVYETLASKLKLDDDAQRRLKWAEMNTELRFLYPRQVGYSAFREALAQRKRIFLVSDMYLSTEFLTEVLARKGYAGYEKLIVSSEFRVKKSTGKLFEVLVRKAAVPKDSILHIGDNYEADIKKARQKGLHAFHLRKSHELFSAGAAYKQTWLRDEQRHALDWRALLAVIGNKLHDNPRTEFINGSLFSGDRWCLGYYGLGPLLLGFVKWLYESCQNEQTHALYFLSRDGKLLKQAFDKLNAVRPSGVATNYLLCSRRSVSLAKAHGPADIFDLLYVDYAHRVPLAHLLTHRFGLTRDDVPDEFLRSVGLSWEQKITAADRPKVRQVLESVMDRVLEIAAAERSTYMAYLEETRLRSAQRPAVVDIGYAGTMQESLSQLTGRTDLGGYYLITFRTALKRIANRGIPINSYLAQFVDRHDTHHPFCRHVPLYEALLSSEETSFVRMTRDSGGRLKPLLQSATPAEDIRAQLVWTVHDGALEFVNDVLAIFGERIFDMDIEPNKTLRVLDRFFSAPHAVDAAIFQGIQFEDAYGGSVKSLLPLNGEHSAEYIWREGAAALAPPGLNRVTKDNPAAGDTRMAEVMTSLAVRHGDRKSVSVRLINFIFARSLTEKKRRKFQRDPARFFEDSKNRIVRVIGDHYLRRLQV